MRKPLLLCLVVLLPFTGSFAKDDPIISQNATGLKPVSVYVSPDGSDTNKGTLKSPIKNIAKAVELVGPGDTIFLHGGRYVLDTTLAIRKDGTPDRQITLKAYPGEQRPILDFSEQPRHNSAKGIVMTGSYWYIYGFDLKAAGDNGMYLTGNHNTIEFCTFSENGDTGLQLSGGASDNRIINCDSFYNRDKGDENADGFAYKMDVGSGNYFYGCRSYQNSDDGWDGYLRGANDVSNTMENCWAFRNGYLKDGTVGQGDGNGFKTGGYDKGRPQAHNVKVIRCISAFNLVNGYDRNSNIGDIEIYNCSAQGNGRSDYAFPEGKNPQQATGKKIVIKNCLTLGGAVVMRCTPYEWSNNSWTGELKTSDDDFESTDYTELYKPRKPNGDLPDINYLKLKPTSALIDKGIDIGMPYSGKAPDIGAREIR